MKHSMERKRETWGVSGEKADPQRYEGARHGMRVARKRELWRERETWQESNEKEIHMGRERYKARGWKRNI